jgi:hypothetical protein
LIGGDYISRDTGSGTNLIVDVTDGATASLKAGTGQSQFKFDANYPFSIASDTKANILSGIGGGTQRLVVDGTTGDVDISTGDLTVTLGDVDISTGDLTVSAGTITIDKSQLDYQENLTVDSGATEVIATVSIVEYKAVFFDYVVSESTNIRAGTVMTTHMGGSTVFTDNSTTDIGDTSDVIFSTDISGSDLRLLATTATDGWEIKVMIRAL